MRLITILLIVALLIGGCDSDTTLAPELETVVIALEAPDRYFIHITDIHADEPSSSEWWTGFIDMVNASPDKPLFIVATGDIVRDPRPAFWGTLLAPLTKYDNSLYIDSARQIPIYFCAGNHDTPSHTCLYCDTVLSQYEYYVGDAVYAIDVAPQLHIISMFSGGTTIEGNGLRSTDMGLMKLALDAHNDTWGSIVLTHHPYVGPGGFLFVNNREWFLSECVEHDVDLVLSGHIHHRVYDLEGSGVWNKDGGLWRDGDGTRFVVTDALKNWCYRKIYLTDTGISPIGPIESFGPVLVAPI